MSERDAIDVFLVEASRRGWKFSRNNSGLAHFPDGSTVRYGLFTPGGSDLIGWIPYRVHQGDVGSTLPIFSAVEVKTGKGRLTDDQKRFLTIVERAGGFAAWGTEPLDLIRRLEGHG